MLISEALNATTEEAAATAKMLRTVTNTIRSIKARMEASRNEKWYFLGALGVAAIGGGIYYFSRKR